MQAWRWLFGPVQCDNKWWPELDEKFVKITLTYLYEKAARFSTSFETLEQKGSDTASSWPYFLSSYTSMCVCVCVCVWRQSEWPSPRTHPPPFFSYSLPPGWAVSFPTWCWCSRVCKCLYVGLCVCVCVCVWQPLAPAPSQLSYPIKPSSENWKKVWIFIKARQRSVL